MSAELELPRMPLNESFMPSAAIKSTYNGDFLQTTKQQDSQHYSKEIIKGFVIVLPMVVALILAPMLLSYSRRRLFSRTKSRVRCCCRRKAIQNNRDDQRVIIEISEQNVAAENTSTKEQLIIEKFPMKPTLKKSKMFVETAGITSDPNETQVKEAEAADVEHASGRCFPEISLVNFGAKMLDRRRFDEGQSTAHSRLTVFENNAYEDTIPSLVESSVDVSYASSPVTRVRDINFGGLCQNNCTPNMELNKHSKNNSSAFQISQYPGTSQSFSRQYERNDVLGIRQPQSRVRRHFSNKERWQPLYKQPKDPETVSMFGYEFANDVIQGHVPPSPLLPAPFKATVPKGVSELQNSRESAIANEYTTCKPIDKEAKASSFSPRLYSPHVGAASTKLSTVSTRRSKRKMKKSRRYRDQLRQRWQRRLPVFNTGFQFGTMNSYGPANNEKISGYIGNRSHGNMAAEDAFENVLMRHRIQISETTLLEEIWEHVKMLVERANQEQDHCDAKENLSEQHSDESSAHTVVPASKEQLDSPLQNETSSTEGSSGISVQMYPCLRGSNN